ncbi:MAG: hypothetical protein ACWA44_02560 [Thiotrichales bacterium]
MINKQKTQYQSLKDLLLHVEPGAKQVQNRCKETPLQIGESLIKREGRRALKTILQGVMAAKSKIPAINWRLVRVYGLKAIGVLSYLAPYVFVGFVGWKVIEVIGQSLRRAGESVAGSLSEYDGWSNIVIGASFLLFVLILVYVRGQVRGATRFDDWNPGRKTPPDAVPKNDKSVNVIVNVNGHTTYSK